jgi:hypothetical protein
VSHVGKIVSGEIQKKTGGGIKNIKKNWKRLKTTIGRTMLKAVMPGRGRSHEMEPEWGIESREDVITGVD